MLTAIILGVLIWLVVLVVSTLIVSLLHEAAGLRDERILAIIIQALYTMLSVIMAALVGGLGILGYRVCSCPWGLLGAVLYSLAIVTTSTLVPKLFPWIKAPEPPIRPRGWLDAIILFAILAPIGEETLFRGLLEGYLLVKHVNTVVAVLVPATLFSLVHVVAYREAKAKTRLIIALASLGLGLVMGYYRAAYDSILPAILGHSAASLTGYIAYKTIENVALTRNTVNTVND